MYTQPQPTPLPTVSGDGPATEEEGWKVVSRKANRKRTQMDSPPPGPIPPRDRRRRVDGKAKCSTGVGTSDRVPISLGRFSALASDSPATSNPPTGPVYPMPFTQQVVSPTPRPQQGPSQNMFDFRNPARPDLVNESSNACASGRQNPNHGQSPAPEGSGTRMDMEVDAPQAQQENGRTLPPLNVPFQQPNATDPFVFSFNMRTPRPADAAAAYDRPRSPPSRPPPPLFGGNLNEREIPRSPPHIQDAHARGSTSEIATHRGMPTATGNHGGQFHVDQQQPRMDPPPPPLPGFDYGDAAPPGRRESSIPPPYGTSVWQREHDTPFGHVGGRAPIPPPSLPVPQFTTSTPVQRHGLWSGSAAATTAAAAATSRNSHGSTHMQFPPLLGLQPEMRIPRGGWPGVRFDDPDSTVRGSDMNYIAELRNAMETSGSRLDRATVVVYCPMIRGHPPMDLAQSAMDRVTTSINAITGETRFTVCPPRPAPGRPLGPQGKPLGAIFFARDLTRRGADMMLEKHLVSSPLITYFVFPLTVRPEIVIILGKLMTNVGSQIPEMVRSTFGGTDIRNILAVHVAMNPRFDGHLAEVGVESVLSTLEVNVAQAGRRYDAQVYIWSPTTNAEGWRHLRAAVARIPFDDGYNSRPSVEAYQCGVCLGNDHLEERCPYPTLEGWQGPVPPPPQLSEPAPQLGNTLIFNPRFDGDRNVGIPPPGGAGGWPRRGRTGPHFAPGEGPAFSLNGRGSGGHGSLGYNGN